MDIDKQYLMEFSLDDNGIIYTLSDLKNTRASMNDMLLLPMPSGMEINSVYDQETMPNATDTYILFENDAKNILDA